MNNRLEIYQNNTLTLACYVVGGLNLDDFTPHLTVKKKASDDVAILSKTGIVVDPSTTINFSFSTTDTSLAPGNYVYDVVIDSSTQVHTLVKDVLVILDGVK
jgi:hypothetical protein